MPLTRAEAERVLRELTRGRGQIEDITAGVQQAASWCARFLDLDDVARSLRPPRIAPHPLYANRWDALDDVARKRSWDLRKHGVASVERPSGRLLVYFPDADLADGAAEIESRGFFDEHNAPPWGTWIGVFDDGAGDPSFDTYSLAWVPDSLVDLANQGIEVNPETCIAWLRNSNVRVREVIEHLDLTEILLIGHLAIRVRDAEVQSEMAFISTFTSAWRTFGPR